MQALKGQIRVKLGIGLMAGSLAWVLMLLGLTATLEYATLDARFTLAALFQNQSRESGQKAQVVVVGIDTPSLSELGSWPWPRSYHAQLLERLEAAGARAVGFDVIFAEPAPEPAEDRTLASQLTGELPVVLPVIVEAAERRRVLWPGEYANPDSRLTVKELTYPIKLLQGKASLGHIGLVPDRDGIVRRVKTDVAGLPSFAVQLARAAGYSLSDEGLPKEFLVNWSAAGGIKDSAYTLFPVLSYRDVLSGNFRPELVRDKIVIVGSVAPGLKADFFPTPLRLFGYLPGVLFQAAAVQTVCDAAFISQFPATPWGALALALLAGIISAQLYSGRKPQVATLLFLALVAIMTGLALVLFRHKVWLVMVGPVLLPSTFAYTLALVQGQLAAERSKTAIRETFGRYVPTSVLNQLLANPDSAKLGGSEKHVAVFFADIRGFTSYTESTAPQEVVQELNKVYDSLVPIVEKHGGIVDKFLGDALMAVFGAPVELAYPEEAAVRAALEVLEQNLGSTHPFRLGIGLASGSVVAGNIGTKDRLSYTVIGTAVNTAARLEELAKAGELLVTGEVQANLPPDLRARLTPLGLINLKGLAGSVEVYSYQEAQQWSLTKQS
ncbi:MAG: adenylate/guanylate cyclase domain-containing protein [Firmicutes bacterium]|nr:adenylate/guanylate cyclase domain-containing protein [Bacillota bacterium]